MRGTDEELRGTTTVFPIGEGLRGTGEWLRCTIRGELPATGEALRADAAAEELLRGTLHADTVRTVGSVALARPTTLLMGDCLSAGARREDGPLEDSSVNPAATSLLCADADLTGNSTADADPRSFCAEADLLCVTGVAVGARVPSGRSDLSSKRLAVMRSAASLRFSHQ